MRTAFDWEAFKIFLQVTMILIIFAFFMGGGMNPPDNGSDH